MNKTSTILLATLLLGAVALVATPPAAAHTCIAQNPATQCGTCPVSTVIQHHVHLYSSGSIYCVSVWFIGAALP